VVWSGNKNDGFYASHRILSTATNLGESIFGPATGRKLTFRSIADTVSKENRIYREWIVRDNLGIVLQLGFDPLAVARSLAAKTKTTSDKAATQDHFGVNENREGLYTPSVYVPRSKGFDIGDFILSMYNRVWEWRLFNTVSRFYSDQCYLHFIGNRHLAGVSRLQGVLISLFSSFPRAKLLVERVTANYREDVDQWDVSVRWKLQGLHEGVGYFGTPSNKPVEISGITHHRVHHEKIVEDWIMFDGIDVFKQIVDVPENTEA
jgi:predicted ester cyclase